MKNKVNKQIIKALSVGVAASMALQPIAVCAEEPGAPAPEPSSSIPSSNLSEATPQDAPGVADAAQADAEVVSHPASQEVESEDKGGDLQVTTEDANTATDDILVNHAKDGEDPTNAVAGEAGEAEVNDENGKPVKVDLSQKVIDEANDVKNDTNISGAETDIDYVKKDLIIAESADRGENNFSNAASATVKDIQEKTDALEQKVNNALEQADTLANKIKNASKISDAQKDYDDLNQLVEDTSDAVDTYNKVLYGDDGKSGLMARYEAAQKLLENAQNRYELAIGEDGTEEKPGTGAKGSVEAAASKVAAAQKEVDELAEAIKDAKENIETVNRAALDIAMLQDEINKDAADGLDVSDKQDQLFVKVMESYYAEKMLPENAFGTKIDKVGDYFKVTYKVPKKHGPGYTVKEKYFDYNTNEAGEFVMFPKTQEEVFVANYVAKYEKDNNVKLEDKTVYTFDDYGYTYYALSVELGDDLVKVGDNLYVKFGDGKILPVKPLNPATAPTSTADIQKVNDTKQVDSVENKKVSYTIDDYGRLIETTTADVTTTTYKKFATALHDYIKDGYLEETKLAELDELKKDENIIVTEIKTDSKTFYVVSGTYTSSYIITLDEKTNIYKRHETGWHGQKAEEAKTKSINETLTEILNGLDGYKVSDNTLAAEIKSLLGIHSHGEDILITGRVVVTKDGVEAQEIKSDEFESEGDAKNNLLSKVNLALASDKPGDASIHCWNWANQDGWDQKVSFSVDTSAQTKTDQYEKLSYYIEYIKKIDEQLNEGQVISQTAYYYYARAYEFLDNSLMDDDLALNVDQFELIQQAKELRDKYQQYANDVKTVQDDIEKTNDDITTLSNAIKTLDQNHGQKTAGQVLKPTLGELSMAKYFGVSDEDIQEFFGEEHDGKLEDMSIDELSKFLEYLKDKAENKKEAIEGLLEDLIEKRDTSKEDLKKTIDRLTPDDDNDNDDDSSSSDDDTTTSGTVVTRPRVTPLVAEQGTVLGETRKTSGKKASTVVETVATDDSDDAVVEETKQEETKTPEAPKTETEIADNDTALAATPELEEKGFAWWILLVLAAAAGVSVEEYVRRKNLKAKAEAKDSTKINK